MVTELVVRSEEAKHRSRELLKHSDFLLARSDALLRRFRAPSGAADTDDSILQERIARTAREYEVELADAVTFLFHAVCYHAWKSYPAAN